MKTVIHSTAKEIPCFSIRRKVRSLRDFTKNLQTSLRSACIFRKNLAADKQGIFCFALNK
jgi:hypothetical protein